MRTLASIPPTTLAAITVFTSASFAAATHPSTLRSVGAESFHPLAPEQVRGVVSMNGSVIATTPWQDYSTPLGGTDALATYAYDAYDSGSSVPGLPMNGNRYLFLPAYAAPQTLEDITVLGGTEGMLAKYVDLAFVVDPHCPAGVPPTDVYVTVLGFEEDTTSNCVANPAFKVGVQAKFSVPAAGLYVMNLDLTSTTASVPLPSDGVGGVLIGYTTDPLGLDIACAYTVHWCTGGNELPPEPRAGVTGPSGLVDDATWSIPPCSGTVTNLPDGLFSTPCECYDFQAKWGSMPDVKVLSPGIGLGVVLGVTCQPDCDASGSLTIDDFICFQTFFSLGDPAADCDASGTLSIDDFICFQTFFVLGC